MKILIKIVFFLFYSFQLFAADNIATLQALYPKQSKAIIKSRIDNSKNLHKFYRSFVRYYYSLLKNNPALISELSTLKTFVGAVSGDPHIENFGFLVDKTHRAHLTFNDFDDADKNSLMIDVLRHLISALMVMPDLDVENYLQYYYAGLDGENIKLGTALQQIKNEAEKKGHRLPKDEIDTDTKTFTKYKKVVLEMTAAETNSTRKKLETLLQLKYGAGVKLYDFYKRTKDSGGSAWQVRYELIITIKNQLHFLELKEFTTAAPAYYLKSNKSNNDRLTLLRENLMPAAIKDEFDLVTFQGEAYLTTMIWDGEKGIDFQDIAEKHWEEIINTEVQLLGHLHGKSMIKDKSTIKLGNYRDAISALPVKNWKSSAKKIIGKLSETYQNVKN